MHQSCILHHPPQVPLWVQQQVEAPLVGAALLPAGWVDSAALNMYHDGSEGIQVRCSADPRSRGSLTSTCSANITLIN